MKQGVIDALAKDNRLLNETLPPAFFEPDQRRLSFRGASKARGYGMGMGMGVMALGRRFFDWFVRGKRLIDRVACGWSTDVDMNTNANPTTKTDHGGAAGGRLPRRARARGTHAQTK